VEEAVPVLEEEEVRQTRQLPEENSRMKNLVAALTEYKAVRENVLAKNV
jgi:hypothetical protein